MPSRVSVAVFAYNEARNIAAALDGLLACAPEADELAIFVLINGCTDGTERIVRRYACAHRAVRPEVIAVGDKANAWNHYTHHLAPPDADMHVFTDGDLMVVRGSIAAMLATFAAEAEANGCAGLPLGGRSEQAFAAKLRSRREMAGNLYALRGTFLARVRAAGVRLPFGVFGEDGLVTMLAKCDLDAKAPIVDRRVSWAEAARFRYERLTPFRRSHWRILRNRLMRYAIRRQQANMLYPLLFEHGTAAMPGHIADIYARCSPLMELGWNGLATPFDWIAVRRIRRDIRLGERAKTERRAHLYS